MRERRWGRIINMLNTLAKTPVGGSAPTSVIRAAGMALTKVLAGEGAPHNILVNGFNIGRFWRKGPQETLYVPGSLLVDGENSVVVFETEGIMSDTLEFADEPVLGE